MVRAGLLEPQSPMMEAHVLTMRQAVKGWLKAGTLTEGAYTPTERGTPQGGVISPLLMNIALHGMESALVQAYKVKDRPQVIRYADDFAVFHNTEEGVKKAQSFVESWLKDIGLELKPSKTRLSHTLTPYQGNVGLDFLGFSIRQYPVGKNRTGRNGHGTTLGYKTLIKPSKEAIRRQARKLGDIQRACQADSQERLIRQLNPVIRGWSNYYRTVVAKVAFNHCDHADFNMTRAWARRKHPRKNMYWIKDRYWKTDKTHKWLFRDQHGHTLRNHGDTQIRRHVKVKGNASPLRWELAQLEPAAQTSPAAQRNAGATAPAAGGKMPVVRTDLSLWRPPRDRQHHPQEPGWRGRTQ
jgi:RNA-directed DNA polymerase